MNRCSTLMLAGENFDPMRQQLSTYRSSTEYIGDSERVLTLTVEADGNETPILKYRYKRK